MKSGRHHKQTSNELADWLGEHIQQWRPYFPHIGIVAAVLLAGAVIYIINSGEDTSSATAWQSYYSAYGEPKVEDALKGVAEKQKNTLPGRWAKLALADQEIRQATMQIGQNPKEAKGTLARAEKTLKEAEEGTKEPDLLIRVHMSLAKVYETQNKLEEARKYYGKVAAADKDGTFGKAAAKALKRLEPRNDVQDVLAWLDKQDISQRAKPTGSGFDFGPPESLPERPDLSIPGETKLGSRPSLGPDLKGPTFPGIESPLFPKGETPMTETPKTDTPKTETKAPPAVPTPVKPAVPMPSKAKPAVPTPVKPAATEEKPAEKEKSKPSENETSGKEPVKAPKQN